MALVAVASLLGASSAASDSKDSPSFLNLVSRVRGAGAGTIDDVQAASAGSAFSLLPADAEAAEEFVNRGAPAEVPATGDAATALAPLATPVPIDPSATPLAAPAVTTTTATTTTATTGSTTLAAPTSRGGTAPAPAPVIGSGGLVWPVPGGTVTQGFHGGHLAVDIASDYGSTVVAAQSGVVTSAGWRNNGGGYVIEIDHGNGMVTLYNHLGSLWVTAGQSVFAGQGIAGVGCTGLCTGPHVHFQVIVDGVIDNPGRYF